MILDQPRLNLVHRLDRVTSGLVILAKVNQCLVVLSSTFIVTLQIQSPAAANRLSREIQAKTTTKVYLARVKGRFPGRLSHLQLLHDDELNNFVIKTSLAAESDNVKDEGDDENEQICDHAIQITIVNASNTMKSSSNPASSFSCFCSVKISHGRNHE